MLNFDRFFGEFGRSPSIELAEGFGVDVFEASRLLLESDRNEAPDPAPDGQTGNQDRSEHPEEGEIVEVMKDQHSDNTDQSDAKMNVDGLLTAALELLAEAVVDADFLPKDHEEKVSQENDQNHGRGSGGCKAGKDKAKKDKEEKGPGGPVLDGLLLPDQNAFDCPGAEADIGQDGSMPDVKKLVFDPVAFRVGIDAAEIGFGPGRSVGVLVCSHEEPRMNNSILPLPGEFLDDGFEVTSPGEIGPLVGIVFEIVKFFGPVGVADVAPAFGADGVIALVEDCEDLAIGFPGRFFEEGDERGPVE